MENNINSTRLQELVNQTINDQESINNLILELDNELELNTSIKSEFSLTLLQTLLRKAVKEGMYESV